MTSRKVSLSWICSVCGRRGHDARETRDVLLSGEAGPAECFHGLSALCGRELGCSAHLLGLLREGRKLALRSVGDRFDGAHLLLEIDRLFGRQAERRRHGCEGDARARERASDALHRGAHGLFHRPPNTLR